MIPCHFSNLPVVLALLLSQIQTALSHQAAPVFISTRHIQVCFPAQVPSSNTPSPNSVEQRLLELNRQSAAARGRLLELIEQQKQSISVKVSPSVSPIPPSAFSPNIAGTVGKTQLIIVVTITHDD